MKRFATILLPLVCLLVGCSSGEIGYLDVPASPSAVFSNDRPGYSEAETSENDTSGTVNRSSRNMTFVETEAVGLSRVYTREGDLEVLGAASGDGVLFVLSRRESGISVTGYDGQGNGLFAGQLEETYKEPRMLGFAAGYACLYCPVASRVVSCRTDGSYVWFPYESAETVSLYENGYVFIRGNKVSLCTPEDSAPAAIYVLPSDCTWKAGNETSALIEKDGVLYTMKPGGKPEPLPVLASYEGGGYVCGSVVCNPQSGIAFFSPQTEELLFCGDDFTVEKQAVGLVIASDGGDCAVLPYGGAFAFHGRTESGFWYTVDGQLYFFDSSELVHASRASLPFGGIDDLHTVVSELTSEKTETSEEDTE